ncbi:hypothetical protein AB3S75_031543 [Citrus x aurantiifolia]
MDFTTDKLRSLVGKWHTLIEAYVDVQTTDNFPLRLFCIGFTKRLPNQVRRAYHAQTARLDRFVARGGRSWFLGQCPVILWVQLKSSLLK